MGFQRYTHRKKSVHGFAGDPRTPWAGEKADVFWPVDLLSACVKEERARILINGYEADMTSTTKSGSKNVLWNQAELMSGISVGSQTDAKSFYATNRLRCYFYLWSCGQKRFDVFVRGPQ